MTLLRMISGASVMMILSLMNGSVLFASFSKYAKVLSGYSAVNFPNSSAMLWP